MNIRKTCLLLTAAVTLHLLAGCSSQAVKGKGDLMEENGIHEMWVQSEFAYVPSSLQQLYEDSDFAAKLFITESEGKFYDESADIYTEFSADIVTLYKGEYHGECFRTEGGYVTLREYAERMIAYDSRGLTMENVKAEFTEEQLENDWVFLNNEESHAPQTGETILFFGKYWEDGKTIGSAAGGRSVYLYDGDTVSIQFRGSESAFLKDLQECYDAAVEGDTKTRVVTVICDSETLENALQA